MFQWAFLQFEFLFKSTSYAAFILALGNLIVNTTLDIAFGYSLRARGR